VRFSAGILRRRFQKTQAECLIESHHPRDGKVTELLHCGTPGITFSSSISSRWDCVLLVGMRLLHSGYNCHQLHPKRLCNCQPNRAMLAQRKSIDCRNYPSDKNCSLKISGTEEEVLDAAVQHAASVHGHENTPELREQIKQMLKDERD
jgi:hypothetical protein